MINSVLDNRFRIEDIVAKSVSGGVFRGKDLETGQQVALKVLYVPPNADPNFGVRFRREADVLFELSHPNIVKIIHTAMTEDGVLYYAMNYIHGKTLEQELQLVGRLEPDAAADLLDEVAAALDAAHARQIVHRDVTPSNIMFEPVPGKGSVAKLIDFGFAKDLGMNSGSSDRGPATGRLRLGVAAYLSPEVLAGKPATPLSDVHALGATMYTALTGVHPFHREHEIQTIAAVLEDLPPRFEEVCPGHGIQVEVEESVRRALAKRPSARPASAGEFAREFRAALSGVRPASVKRALRPTSSKGGSAAPPPNPPAFGNRPASSRTRIDAPAAEWPPRAPSSASSVAAAAYAPPPVQATARAWFTTAAVVAGLSAGAYILKLLFAT